MQLGRDFWGVGACRGLQQAGKWPTAGREARCSWGVIFERGWLTAGKVAEAVAVAAWGRASIGTSRCKWADVSKGHAQACRLAKGDSTVVGSCLLVSCVCMGVKPTGAGWPCSGPMQMRAKRERHACTSSHEGAKTTIGVLLQASKLGLAALGQAVDGPRLRLKLCLLFD